ncbi:MAG TPA: ComEC/Rec2 family competence protein, partial [Clostridia bacterium]|nr:ComEC/Rec2 family competence protein [Clostridia bacterium]
PIDTVQGNMVVHFIDVGQGDSILIQSPSGQNMLIDAGDNNKGDKVVEYLENLGINRVDFLVGTHPHADHIGGLDDVIDNFYIGQIYMPKVAHTSKTYEDVLMAVKRKNLKIKATHSGMDIPFEGLRAEVLAPDSDLKSDDLNDYSIVIRLTYGETRFLFQGDAEKSTEDYILESGRKIKANVIKLGHHGSSTSNTKSYIEAVDPDYAVITLGEDNRYGHPHKEIVDLMEENDITIFRTDRDGDVVVVSDGESVSFVE